MPYAICDHPLDNSIEFHPALMEIPTIRIYPDTTTFCYAKFLMIEFYGLHSPILFNKSAFLSSSVFICFFSLFISLFASDSSFCSFLFFK